MNHSRKGIRIVRCLFILAAGVLICGVPAEAGEVQLSLEGTNCVIRIEGDADDDWRLESSSDLVSWSELAGFGSLLSGHTNAPSRVASDANDAQRFYRTCKTGGLYDRTLLRTLSLTFTQANWQSRLTSGRTTGSNTLGVLSLDNGATNGGVGARYRGNTSFTGMGGSAAPVKKSLNLELDYANTNADEPNHPRKWQFPAGTSIAAGGYLLVWADEDTTDRPGLHASFKLSGDNEAFYLADPDANFNAILDAVVYGRQETDRSYGRTAADPEEWAIMDPTPGLPNR